MDRPLNAACRERGFRYSQLIAGLEKIGCELDRRTLAEMAVLDPTGFDADRRARSARPWACRSRPRSRDAVTAAVPLDAFRGRTRAPACRRGGRPLRRRRCLPHSKRARVEFVGARSGRLKSIQKLLGGLDAADKPAGGRLFNDAKNAITALLAAAQDRMADRAAGPAAAIDVTLPGERRAARASAPDHADDPAGAGDHGSARLRERRWPRGRGPVAQLRGPGDRARASGPRSARQLLPRRGPRGRPAAAAVADEHGADPRDGEAGAAAADRVARPRLPSRHRRRHALPDVPPGRGPARRAGHHDGPPQERAADVRLELPRRRRAGAFPALVLPVHRAERRGGHGVGRPLGRDGGRRHGRPRRARGRGLRPRLGLGIRLRPRRRADRRPPLRGRRHPRLLPKRCQVPEAVP